MVLVALRAGCAMVWYGIVLSFLASACLPALLGFALHRTLPVPCACLSRKGERFALLCPTPRPHALREHTCRIIGYHRSWQWHSACSCSQHAVLSIIEYFFFISPLISPAFFALLLPFGRWVRTGRVLSRELCCHRLLNSCDDR